MCLFCECEHLIVLKVKTTEERLLTSLKIIVSAITAWETTNFGNAAKILLQELQARNQVCVTGHRLPVIIQVQHRS